MPIYLYQCEECGRELELVQTIGGKYPMCCDSSMDKLPTSPSLVRFEGKGGTRTFSKGYKEGYAKEYQKDIET